MARRIQISRPPSGLNVCFDEEALELLGGKGVYLDLITAPTDDGSIEICISKGRYAKVSSLETGKWAGRIQISKSLMGRLKINLDNFGPYTATWSWKDGVVTFIIPHPKELSAPIKHTVRKRKAPELPLHRDDKWGKLARVIHEFNEIIVSPDYKGVDFYIGESKILDGSKLKATYSVVRTFE